MFADVAGQKLVPEANADDFELIEGFVGAAEADGLLRNLVAQVAWRDEYLQMFGRRIRSPRRVAWYGDLGEGYVYSGEAHIAQGWLPALEPLKHQLSERLTACFNFVLLNYYRNHNDSMGWHADNEPELGGCPVIASISLGEARTFRVRQTQRTKGVRRTSAAIELTHGSLLVMRGQSQAQFQHSLPKSSQPRGARLNLTFRQVLKPTSCASTGSLRGK